MDRFYCLRMLHHRVNYEPSYRELTNVTKMADAQRSVDDIYIMFMEQLNEMSQDERDANVMHMHKTSYVSKPWGRERSASSYNIIGSYNIYCNSHTYVHMKN